MTYIYVASFPFQVENKEIIPESRDAEIKNTKNPEHKAQKYYAWKLLEKVICENFSKSFDSFSFSKSDGGKWQCPDFYFSLSHTKNCVAVIVSDIPCGIDVEVCAPQRFGEKLAKKIMNSAEYEKYSELQEDEKTFFALEMWTKKESIFKMLSEKTFISKNIDTNLYFSQFCIINEIGLSFALEKEDEIKYIIM